MKIIKKFIYALNLIIIIVTAISIYSCTDGTNSVNSNNLNKNLNYTNTIVHRTDKSNKINQAQLFSITSHNFYVDGHEDPIPTHTVEILDSNANNSGFWVFIDNTFYHIVFDRPIDDSEQVVQVIFKNAYMEDPEVGSLLTFCIMTRGANGKYNLFLSMINTSNLKPDTLVEAITTHEMELPNITLVSDINGDIIGFNENSIYNIDLSADLPPENPFYNPPPGYKILNVVFNNNGTFTVYLINPLTAEVVSLIFEFDGDDSHEVNTSGAAAIPTGFSGGYIQAHGVFGNNWGPPDLGGGSAVAMWMPPASSGLTQVVAICSTNNQAQCYATTINNQNPVADVVSNYEFTPAGVAPTVLSTTSDGSVYRLDNNLKWNKTTSLDINMGSNSMVYNVHSKTFEVIGEKPSYDSKLKDNNVNNVNDAEILASEDGTFWLNKFVPLFGKLGVTTNSYCAIENDPGDLSRAGQVWCWGSNDHNKLGLGQNPPNTPTPTRALIPAPIGMASGETGATSYQTLAGGDLHMCALRTSGNKIDCWGDGELGQLGDGIAHGSGYSTPVPTQVSLSGIDSVQKLVAGGSHSCILVDGQVWCWGSNQNKEINGTSSQTIFPNPVQASFNLPYTYTDVATGADFTCGMSSNQVNCWGNHYSLPYQAMAIVESGGGNISISAGGQTACVLTSQISGGNSTNAWCWGDNTYGQVGNGKSGGFISIAQPVVSKDGQLEFKQIFLSGTNTCGLTNIGRLYCWGDNTYQQTGISESGPILNPKAPMNLNELPGTFMTVSVGTSSICSISTEINESSGVSHNTYCLGLNDTGQLGIETTNSESKPHLVNNISVKNLPK